MKKLTVGTLLHSLLKAERAESLLGPVTAAPAPTQRSTADVTALGEGRPQGTQTMALRAREISIVVMNKI